MIEKLCFRLLLICFQGSIEDGLKVRRRGRGGVDLSLGHGSCNVLRTSGWWVAKRGSSAASCCIPLMATDMDEAGRALNQC